MHLAGVSLIFYFLFPEVVKEQPVAVEVRVDDDQVGDSLSAARSKATLPDLQELLSSAKALAIDVSTGESTHTVRARNPLAWRIASLISW